MIRKPVDAITSYRIFSGMDIEKAAARYVEFYDGVAEFKNKVLVGRFEDVIRHINQVIAAFVRRFGFSLPFSDNVEEDSQIVKRLGRKRARRERTDRFVHTVATPNVEREQIKQEVKPKVREFLDKDPSALEIYEE